LLLHQAYAQRLAWLPPTHGYAAFDTDLCGLCSAQFPIRGFANTIGGASASGSLAVLHAAQAVRSGRVDACIALGALHDLSSFELQAMRALGALSPGPACRPFDRAHDGFLFGESCAALVLVRPDLGLRSYGSIAGAAHVASGNRGPDPALAGELRAIAAALQDAGLAAQQIDYVNTHGTGTPLGDDTEAAALSAAGLRHAHLNATKSLIGHGISAAGAVEIAAVLLQMQQGRLHPTAHLEDPAQPELNWVLAGQPRPHRIRHALKLSFGFGGIDTAIVLSSP
jgi:malonyl-ACP decarboxylase